MVRTGPLQVAVQAADGSTKFAGIYAFGHNDPRPVTAFVQITSEPAFRKSNETLRSSASPRRTLLLSAEHFLPTVTGEKLISLMRYDYIDVLPNSACPTFGSYCMNIRAVLIGGKQVFKRAHDITLGDTILAVEAGSSALSPHSVLGELMLGISKAAAMCTKCSKLSAVNCCRCERELRHWAVCSSYYGRNHYCE